MDVSEKIIRAKTDYDEVYEAGKKAVVGDKRKNGAFWYQYFNADWSFDVSDSDEEGNEIRPEDDISNWCESLDYPIGSKNLTDFNLFYNIIRENLCSAMMEIIAAPIIKYNGTLDMSNADKAMIARYNKYAEDIGTIIFPNADIKIQMYQIFIALKHIKAEGKINGSIFFNSCPLTKESITSVINALSDTAIGKTATFKKTAKEAAFTDAEWAELIATKPNWSIVLA